MVYLPMAYLFAKKFVGTITPTILELRDELYSIPYSEIDWKEARDTCAKVRFYYALVISPHTIGITFPRKKVYI
jgi:achilleol B synthase